MDFQQRCQLAREGKYVLRVQYRSDGNHHVAYATGKGGWAIYNKMWIGSKDMCQDIVRDLVKKSPDKFFIDEDLNLKI